VFSSYEVLDILSLFIKIEILEFLGEQTFRNTDILTIKVSNYTMMHGIASIENHYAGKKKFIVYAVPASDNGVNPDGCL
jgi:hypothetical protein